MNATGTNYLLGKVGKIMEEKTDKVVGYIEYLGAGGMIGEIVPYTSVENSRMKFWIPWIVGGQ